MSVTSSLLIFVTNYQNYEVYNIIDWLPCYKIWILLVVTQIVSCSPYIDRNSIKNSSKLSNIGSRCSKNDENYNKVELESSISINLTCDPWVGWLWSCS